MLLRQIIETLDTELSRLRRLREIIAPLGISPISLRKLSEQLQAEFQEKLNAPEKPRPGRKLRAVRGRFTRAVRLRKPAEPKALAPAASTGPVVVSREALSRERAFREARRTAAEPAQTRREEATAAPEDLARSLSQRWLAGGSPA